MSNLEVLTSQLEQLNLGPEKCEQVVKILKSSESAEEKWQQMLAGPLHRNKTFAVHHAVYSQVFQEWPHDAPPPVTWKPHSKEVARTNLARAMAERGDASYEGFWRWSVESREDFWADVVARLGIVFDHRADELLDISEGVEKARWFPESSLNIVKSCFLADPSATAIISQRPGGGIRTQSYEALDQLSSQVAQGLVAMGMRPGDRIAVDLPMIQESVAMYLGIIKMGGVVVSIADSFAVEEIATRLRLSGARLVFTQDCIIRGEKKLPLYEKVVQAGAEQAIVYKNDENTKLRESDLDWESFLSDRKSCRPVPSESSGMVNILFSSGTTGDPKVIPWTHLTAIKAAMDGYFHHDIRPGEVVAWPTNLGWMMGPWLIFATLINRGTIALYEDAPMGEGFGKFVQDAHVQCLGLVPSMVKAWRKTGDMEKFDWSCVRRFSSTGECSNAEDYLYLMMLAENAPIVEYCGGTEIGGGYMTGSLVQAASPATFTTPALGIDIRILDDEHKASHRGELFLVPPSIGLSTELLGRDHHEVYFADCPKGPGGETLRRHGDEFEKCGPFYRGLGRVDDTMNLGGIKTSSADIERVLTGVPGIVETAALAVTPSGGGPSELVIYAVSADSKDEKELVGLFQQRIREALNPLFRVADVVVVEKLPRTASNKIMRRVLRAEYSAKPSQ